MGAREGLDFSAVAHGSSVLHTWEGTMKQKRRDKVFQE